MEFVLVHGPPVGPATWRWAAEALASAGHDVVVPDLRRATLSGEPAVVVTDVVAECPSDPEVVVGHSGAGVLLPSIAHSLSSRARPRLVFVDAVIPECDGEAKLDPVVVDLLRTLAVDGVLPPWSVWLGEGGVERMIPDGELRAEVEAELPELPMTLFEVGLPVPEGWCDWPCAYLLLSEDMRDEAERARSLGWSVLEDVGNHLDVVNRATEIARDLLQLVEQRPER
jgi:pimeloyl-ACP methyl ester carboxylesterase